MRKGAYIEAKWDLCIGNEAREMVCTRSHYIATGMYDKETFWGTVYYLTVVGFQGNGDFFWKTNC